MRHVTVEAYRPYWKDLFEREAKLLKSIYKDQIITVHHIGSTSVPGLSAKPIIDLLPVVHSIEAVDAFNSDMVAAGFEAFGENGLKERRFFQKGGEQRTHHVHIFEHGNSEIKRHLIFRDYLMAHPEEAKVYGKLKEALAREYPYDIDSYIQGKTNFVRRLEQAAIDWGKRNGYV